MQFFNLHTHQGTNTPHVVELVNQYPWEFDASLPCYSIGIHPWYIDEARMAEDVRIIEQQLTQPECLALGECGLDKRISIPFDVQLRVFEQHLQWAEQHQKPLVLHIVAAFEELLHVKKKYNPTVPMIIHGFSKSKPLAKQLVEQGFYLSFGKYLLQNPELESVFESVPNDRFFLETDTTSASIETVYEVAARYKKLSAAVIQNQIQHNFNQVFQTNKIK